MLVQQNLQKEHGNFEAEFSRFIPGLTGVATRSSPREPVLEVGRDEPSPLPLDLGVAKGVFNRDGCGGILLLMSGVLLPRLANCKKPDLEPGRDGDFSNGPNKPPDKALIKNRA